MEQAQEHLVENEGVTAAAAAAAVVFLAQSVNRGVLLLVGVVVGIGMRVGPRLIGVQLPVPRSQG